MKPAAIAATVAGVLVAAVTVWSALEDNRVAALDAYTRGVDATGKAYTALSERLVAVEARLDVLMHASAHAVEFGRSTIASVWAGEATTRRRQPEKVPAVGGHVYRHAEEYPRNARYGRKAALGARVVLAWALSSARGTALPPGACLAVLLVTAHMVQRETFAPTARRQLR